MGVIMKSGISYAGGSGSPSESNYGIVQNSALLPSSFGASDRKVYYAVDNGSFFIWNGTAWIEDKVLKQYSVMPTASVVYEDEIVQYIGLPDGTYSQGSLYKCEYASGAYRWTSISSEDIDELTPSEINSLLGLL